MSKKIIVSAAIPIRNDSKTIEKTIKSLLSQTYKKIEIIVIDDYSSDNSEEIINKIKRENKSGINIRFFKNVKNLGPAAARNKGIKEAKGKIVMFTDADCFVPKDWLKKIISQYSGRNIGGVGGFLEPGEKNFIAMLERMQNKYLLKIQNKKIIGNEECPTGYTNSMTYLKKALKEVGGFDEKFKFPSGEDFDLKKRVCKKGYKLVFIPEPIIHLDKYDLEYLLNRIITRGLNKRLPAKKLFKLIYVIFMMPIIFLNVLKKIIKYKRENLI
jgi:glycosyltransferase involved in cell wall biosynthesis